MALHHRSPDSRFLSDEVFRLFVEAVKDYAIYTMDPTGLVTSWNQGAERIKGYTASEILGRSYSCFFTQEDIRDCKPLEGLKVAARQGRFEDQGWRVRKDGSRFWADAVITSIHDRAGNIVGFVKVTRDATERNRAQEALRRANTELAAEIEKRQASERQLAQSESSLRELSLRLLRAQDEERRRLGRELHDSVGQYLAMLKMNLESINVSSHVKPSRLIAQIAQCARLADECLREVRTVSHLLYPPTLEDMGLRSAIPWYLDGFSKRSNIRTTFEIDTDFPRIDKDVEVALFRVLQESLNNVHRHSGSDLAHVSLTLERGGAILEIRDVGRGIPAGLLEESCQDWLGAQGVGLRGMRERMQQLGGALEISSGEKGTIVRAMVPVEASAAASGQSD